MGKDQKKVSPNTHNDVFGQFKILYVPLLYLYLPLPLPSTLISLIVKKNNYGQKGESEQREIVCEHGKNYAIFKE